MWHGPDAMHVIGHQDPGVNCERLFEAHLFDRIPESRPGDVEFEPGNAVVCDGCEEISPARGNRSFVIWHLLKGGGALRFANAPYINFLVGV